MVLKRADTCQSWNQVKSHVIKYYQGTATRSVSKIAQKALMYPHISFCPEQPFKFSVLTSLGLSKDFFQSEGSPASGTNFPDLNETWNKASFSRSEFNISWTFFGGEEDIHNFKRENI
jgi:hypothetical protein